MTTAHVGMQFVGLASTPAPFTAATMDTLGIDALTPQTNYLPPQSNITEVQQAGRQVWTYTSMQPYKPYAAWRLDNSLIDPRILFWQVRAFGFDGLLHWGLNQWGGESTMAPINLSSTDGFLPSKEWGESNPATPWMQGDGKLLLCGTDEPIPTSRLFNIRDGMDDYDYLALLHSLDPTAAAVALAKVTQRSCIYCVSRNVTLLRVVRAEIADAIEHALSK